MYTCGELTHSPSGADWGGPAGQRPASRLQKREAARNGRFVQGLMDRQGPFENRRPGMAALLVLAIRDVCMPCRRVRPWMAASWSPQSTMIARV